MSCLVCCVDLICDCNPWHLDSSSSQEEVVQQLSDSSCSVSLGSGSSSNGEIDVHLEKSFEYMAHRLPTNFDARESLVANFDRRRRVLSESLEPCGAERVSATRQIISSELSRKMLQTARSLLENVGSQAHEARKNLTQAMLDYELAIRSQGNLAERALIIAEFQTKKYEVGYEAECDRQVAAEHLLLARSGTACLRDRVNAYQIALMYTNEPVANQRLMQEYCSFCDQFK